MRTLLRTSSGLLALLALLATAGCRPRDGRAPVRERILMQTDFEDLAGWHPQAPGLTTARAHSGHYSIMVSPQQPYSTGFRARLGQLSPHHRPRRLTLSAWVWVPAMTDDARLVVVLDSANSPDHPIMHKNIFLNESLTFGSWRPVQQDIDLPRHIHADTPLTIYLWNGMAKQPVYADDLLLTELW